MSATLTLHRGAVVVSEAELKTVPTPPQEGRYFPVPHHRVLSLTRERLAEAGYTETKAQLGLTKDGRRFFGTLTLSYPLSPGVSLAVGVRNSTDKSLCLGWCAGSHVFVCDNLAFTSELTVKRRHTTHGEFDFGVKVSHAITALADFKKAEADRIVRMQTAQLTEDQALAWIVRGLDRKVIHARQLPAVVAEWRKPSFDYGSDDPTVWRLFNAFTTVLGKSRANPFDHAAMTTRLGDMIAMTTRPELLVVESNDPTTAA
ncbi:MAG: DUF945 domain-containing protein [Gemmataceae bacterium]|nr:DUF945 domain-containing protein [Gemmataceae bacterium]